MKQQMVSLGNMLPDLDQGVTELLDSVRSNQRALAGQKRNVPEVFYWIRHMRPSIVCDSGSKDFTSIPSGSQGAVA